MNYLHEHRRQLAQDLIGELLEAARRDEERGRGGKLRMLVRAGKAVGIGTTALAERARVSRPTIYEFLKREGQQEVDDPDEVVLAVVAASGAITPSALASALAVDQGTVESSLARLEEKDVVNFAAAGYGPGTEEQIALLTMGGEAQLRQQLRRALSRRPESWVAYLAISEKEAGVLGAAAEKRFGSTRMALLPSTTTSSMIGPELGIAFDASDRVDLFNQAAIAWEAIRADLSLDPSPVCITAFSAPLSYSGALTAFGHGIAEANPDIADRALRIVADAVPKNDELTTGVRALTEAARALRRLVDQESPPPDLSKGEGAFEELQAVAGLHLDNGCEKAQRALLEALKRGTDKLGPLPAGRLGSFRGPDEQPHLVEEVSPTPSDVIEIARASGRALGHAHSATDGDIDAIAAIQAVLEPDTGGS